jgi:hypothetical protein
MSVAAYVLLLGESVRASVAGIVIIESDESPEDRLKWNVKAVRSTFLSVVS